MAFGRFLLIMNFRLPAWLISRDIPFVGCHSHCGCRIERTCVMSTNYIQQLVQLDQSKNSFHGSVARRLLRRRMCSLRLYFSCCRRNSPESPVCRHRRAVKSRLGQEGGDHAPPQRCGNGGGPRRRLQNIERANRRAQSPRCNNEQRWWRRRRSRKERRREGAGRRVSTQTTTWSRAVTAPSGSLGGCTMNASYIMMSCTTREL
jgi:hypothetical protein